MFSFRSTIVKQRWEKDRAHIGSKWAWLCHQITSINQKIYQLDTLLQSTQPKENIQFASSLPFSAPCVCGSQQTLNDTLTSSPSKKNGQHTQISKCKKTTPSPYTNRPCSCQIKQIILSNPSLMAQQSLQIKDLIEFSLPALLMEQSNQTSARTRMIRHAPKRKLIRAKKDQMKYQDLQIGKSVDPSYHAFLSQPTG